MLLLWCLISVIIVVGIFVMVMLRLLMAMIIDQVQYYKRDCLFIAMVISNYRIVVIMTTTFIARSLTMIAIYISTQHQLVYQHLIQIHCQLHNIILTPMLSHHKYPPDTLSTQYQPPPHTKRKVSQYVNVIALPCLFYYLNQYPPHLIYLSKLLP